MTAAELRRREAARAAIRYAFDLIKHDGKDLLNLPFLNRKATLARLLRDAKVGILAGDGPYRARARMPAWCRGCRFQEGGRYLSLRPVSSYPDRHLSAT
jgi:ATP-dependent DNA ligase